VLIAIAVCLIGQIASLFVRDARGSGISMTKKKPIDRIDELTHLRRRVRGYLISGVMDGYQDFHRDIDRMLFIDKKTGEVISFEKFGLLMQERDRLIVDLRTSCSS